MEYRQKGRKVYYETDRYLADMKNYQVNRCNKKIDKMNRKIG